MKKLYAPHAESELKRSRLSFVKILSLVIAATFLSSGALVFSANSAFSNVFLEGVNSAGMSYPQSIISVAGLEASPVSKDNYLTAFNKAGAEKVKASSDYANFLTKTLSDVTDYSPIVNVLTAEGNNLSQGGGSKKEQYKGVVFTNRQLSVSDSSTIQQFVDNDENATPFNVSDLLRGGNTGMQRDVSGTNVMFGERIKQAPNAHSKNDNVAIGTGISILAADSVAVGYKAEVNNATSVAVGHLALAEGKKSIAIGGEGRWEDNPIPPEGRTIAQGEESIAIGRRAKAINDQTLAIGSHAQVTGNRSIALGYDALSSKENSIAIGYMSHALGKSSVAIGGEYNAGKENDYTTAKSDYSTAVGAVSKALEYGSTALGHRAYAFAKNAISIGFYSEANGVGSIALGSDSNVKVDGGVAIGNNSVSNRAAGVFGYAPSLKGEVATNATAQWKSTSGAVSVGDFGQNITRQIIGVAAGSDVTDAANVGQLKDLKKFVKENGWKLSVGGKNGKTVLMDSDVDFSTGSTNLKITKGNEDNKVKFDLAQDVTLTSLKAGTNTLDATGLIITGGPKITTGGIDAGNKKITSIKDGTLSADSHEAVSGSQLFTTNQNVTTVTSGLKTASENIAKYLGGGASYKEGAWTAPTFKIKSVNTDGEEKEATYSDVASALSGVGSSITNVQNKLTEQVNNVVNKVESESFVQQDKTTHNLTIGAKVAGGEINIANKDKGDRTLSGLKAATKDNEAVNKGQLDTNIKKVEDKLAEAVGNVTQQVQGDALLWSDTDNAFVADHKKDGAKTKSKITHLSDGNIASGSTDAVTGGQLYSMNEQLATYFGGEAGYNEKGEWKAPTFKVKTVQEDGNSEEKAYQNVAEALAGVGTSFTNVQNKITNEITNQINHLQSEDSAVVHYDKDDKNGTINYASITLGGKDKTPTALHNIADGAISSESHDAINGKQINKIGEDIAKFLGGEASFKNGVLKSPTYKLSYIAKDGVVTESSLDGVGTALAGLDSNIKNVNDRIKEVSEGVAQDSLNWSNAEGAFVAQHEKEGEKTNSKIKYLAAGEISAASTEAINGSQLFETNNNVATYFGGGAGYDEKGNWKAPTFKVKTVTDNGEAEEQEYKNVAEAFEGVGTSITNVQNKVTNDITNKFNDFTQNITNITQQVQGDALLWNEDEGGICC
ncbi:hypothetical protein [Bartonella tribocorum]|uniref:hypothetical protein n=1 Tax=Bartonella tribocorum TaxID=85701 RepID=UPI001ABB37C4|nr:hypothetical protein [Bartonella tribocorum]